MELSKSSIRCTKHKILIKIKLVVFKVYKSVKLFKITSECIGDHANYPYYPQIVYNNYDEGQNTQNIKKERFITMIVTL